jgi:aspartyl/asparaginyl beta-hydroxylase (cupin superfamily)
MSKPNLWFSLFDFSFDYKGNEPSFWDENQFSWSGLFKENLNSICSELESYIAQNKLDPYFNKQMTNERDVWKTISLKTWGIELFSNQKHFPNTTNLMNKFPEIVSLSFNRLEPGGKILPHCGDTNAIVRCHLGLIIPEQKEGCYFTVRGESKSWKKGEWIVFTDAFVHEAENNTNEDRYILLMDVMRDEFNQKKRNILSTVLTSLFLQKRAQQYGILYKAPQWLIRIAAFFLKPCAWISLKLVNYFKVY